MSLLTPYDLACRRLFAAVVGEGGRGCDTNQMSLILHPAHWAAIIASAVATSNGSVGRDSLHGIPVIVDPTIAEDAMVLRHEVCA